MVYKRAAAILLIVLSGQVLFSQARYWVTFNDKQGVSFNPYEYFDSHTLERRINRGLPLVMFSDLPVNENYRDQVNDISPVFTVSRWLNAVTVSLSPGQVQTIRSLPFVKSVLPVEKTHVVLAKKRRQALPGNEIIDLLKEQTRSLGGDLFKAAGLNGRGVRIAVFDAGFPGVDTLPEFRNIRDEGRIIETWDFVKKKKDVYSFNSHGTGVLACIAGTEDSLTTGLATGAEFLLARTEVQAEVFSEEENWFAAMEWADKHGADIISSSLGYTFNRYFPKQMDGKSTFISRMANEAAGKGILVINAAGNDGDDDWEVIGAPADADSVLTVGGIDSETGIHIDFSSFGPTFDGRLKPNVSAYGDVVTIDKDGNLKKEYGTSFSAPLVTGFAACVMQLHPEWTNMKVFNELEKSGHLYPYYDYAHGYGIPQASYFLDDHIFHLPTFDLKREYSFLTVVLRQDEQNSHGKPDIKTLHELKLIIKKGNKQLIVNNDTLNIVNQENRGMVEKLMHSETYALDKRYLYYHFADKKTGLIRYYAVVNMEDARRYPIDLDNMKDTEILRIHYGGYTADFSK